MRRPTVRALPALLLLTVLALLGCESGPPGSPGPGGDGGATSREPNVVKGRVTDAQGDPVAGATLRIAGYTGAGGLHDDTVTSDASGNYRQSVPAGLYDVHGRAAVTFDGGEYVMPLQPVDGTCDEAESAPGIVEDFVLALTGLDACAAGADPDNASFYLGASVSLYYAPPRSVPDTAELSFQLTPVGPLADGSTGEPLTFTRTVAALGTTFGPLEGTGILHDIPLGRYRISGTATTGGDTQELRFRLADEASAPTRELEFGFEPVEMEPYGIRQRRIELVDAAWTGP